MGVISIQSSLTKLFTVEINDSLQIGVGLSLPTVSPDKIHYAVMLAGSQQGTVCWNTFGMEPFNLEPGTKELFQYTVLECWRKGFTAASSHGTNEVPPGQITCLRIYQWETETRKSGSLPACRLPDVLMHWWVRTVVANLSFCPLFFRLSLEHWE